ncbi:bifunctional [glutamine synthetase] adenylyltransferase/[glutamine synthetase]-adenylyl-L-tyrosine phosphorylase [Hoeflea sp. WL0058]|uniref:Bifunctional glutamine synthetase adenylyltransferase/adenylyl-removing enzyme n=1 Tax=Flavimaribacter sediminis TaxID=2865987 RepID=A0AAE3D361_9HYPH|nr:bifunctional [glutamine synthetase] adenylyltransferase/[glutamine synthetase]-adenylyl-L-tyrosine phosphorylase [Flavimaribacter sediminis]MBW8639486.1 bifunctional [glutamine synthetase] adenylyltransferase/[glutamine synthetase]-adenylyl-L-tyrosine phosphorylase [Flavimaribacter sediminis]
MKDLRDPVILPASQEKLETLRDELVKLADGNPELGAFLVEDTPASRFVLSALTLSQYLRDIALRSPRLILQLLNSEPGALIDQRIEEAQNAWKAEDVNEARLMSDLRLSRQDFSFFAGMYDLSRTVDTRQITIWLSRFAAAALKSAVDFSLLSAHDQGKLRLDDPRRPSRRSGFFVLGMGKFGAEELNYSSDIDIVAIFNPEAGVVRDPDESSDVFSRIVRRLVKIMQERTRDGYVFRTDVRLRPDPGATPLAVPYRAALLYYEGRGQNWERAAFIKARPVAGDIEAGQGFCNELVPFIYRKYLDYATITDIHSIKRQIHAHKGFGKIAVRGHDIKLGRGGIREIEFFVQTQQLIAGGRTPDLRVRSTDEALSALSSAQWLGHSTEESLRFAYWFLRHVENRIQMRRDEQTHTLPESDQDLRIIALMSGYEDVEPFIADMNEVLTSVERHYSRLFEHEHELGTGEGNLVFTGDGDDPNTLEQLSRMGFERPSDISRIIRTWHYGRYKAMHSERARKHLTEIMPVLLKAFAQTRRADEALLNFDKFLSGLPAGIQLFSLLSSNTNLSTLLVSIMASAPRLAEIISRRPHVFDGVLDPQLLAELPNRAYLAGRLGAFLQGDFLYEEILDRLRIFASEQKFLIGVRLLTGAISGDRASKAFSDLADLILEAAFAAVRLELEHQHGRISGGQAAIVGMGKLGSREMTAGSDIDIIVLYAHDPDCADSDGEKPLDPSRYYARLTQRLASALSSPTAEGVLYEVDLRLRPSGNKGPIATSIQSFRKYQSDSAWTWEHMALTRARVVSGDAELVAQARAVFDQVLDRKRDAAEIAADVRGMRMRIEQEKKAASFWDLKLAPGGLMDIEFIAQYLRLMAASEQVRFNRGETRTLDIIKSLAPAMIGHDEAERLVSALKAFTELSQIIRLCIDGEFDPEKAPGALEDLVLRVVDLPDIATLEAHVLKTEADVRAIFDKALPEPEGGEDAETG